MCVCYSPSLCDPMDCSLPGSSVHAILQARILEWVAIPSSRASSQPGLNLGLLHCRQILYYLSHQGMNIINNIVLRVDLKSSHHKKKIFVINAHTPILITAAAPPLNHCYFTPHQILQG